KEKTICGTFTAEVAETKVAQVTMYSRENEHPLLCTMEQA
ncbi:ATP-dependent Clp protease adapter protein ClpS, partial [Vibrio cholerae]